MSTITLEKEIVETLISYAHGSLESALFYGAKTGDISLMETVLALTEETAAPSDAFSAQSPTRNPIISIRDKGHDLLFRAALYGQAKVIDYLVSKGMDVNASDPNRGNTALMAAASSEHHECISPLLNKGANPNMRNKSGDTALHFLTNDFSDNYQASTLLIKAGADVNAVCEGKGYFKTPLIYAITRNSIETVRILLEYGADPTLARYKFSPLNCAKAVSNSCPEMLPLIKNAIKAWPKVSGGAGDAPAQPFKKSPQRPAARVHRFAV